MAIKYRESDAEKLRRTVENFNRKIRRAAARGVENLPETLSIRDLRREIGTRADFNRTINSLRRFSRKGAEAAAPAPEGYYRMTKWERQEIARSLSIINRARAREFARINEMEVKSRGIPLGLKRGEMGPARTKAFLPKQKAEKFRSRSELEEYRRTLAKQAKQGYISGTDEQYKQNYFKALRDVYGAAAEPLIARLDTLPARTMVNKMYAEQEGDIHFIYDRFDKRAKMEILESIWESEIGSFSTGDEDDEEFDI